MRTSMIARETDTFVALGQAVALARAEGAVDPEEAARLSSALVGGILTGCMNLETYARVHDALARLLDQAFQRPVHPSGPSAVAVPDSGQENLNVYLDVVGEAWDRVDWDEEMCRRVQDFVAAVFRVEEGRFGGAAWFRAPLRASLDEVQTLARAAGLLVVSFRPPKNGPPRQGALTAAEGLPPSVPAVVLGWGERRTALLALPED